MVMETTRWCDRCQGRGAKSKASPVEAAVDGTTTQADLCESCHEFIFREWRRLSAPKGVRLVQRRGKLPVAGVPAAERPRFVERRKPKPGSRQFTPVPCPACPHQASTAQALESHLVTQHGYRLPKGVTIGAWRYGNRCPMCGQDCGQPGKMSSASRGTLSPHAMRRHSEMRGLQGLWDAAIAAGDPHRVIEEHDHFLAELVRRAA